MVECYLHIHIWLVSLTAAIVTQNYLQLSASQGPNAGERNNPDLGDPDMNLDDRIKSDLENEAKQIDQAMGETKGLFELATIPFKGGLRRWMYVVSVAIAVLTVLLLWCGYRFFIAESADERIFWGVLFVVSLTGQAMLKLWTWMEVNRNCVLREIKRLEIAIAKLHVSHKV
jgi:hypothetical protein